MASIIQFRRATGDVISAALCSSIQDFSQDFSPVDFGVDFALLFDGPFYLLYRKVPSDETFTWFLTETSHDTGHNIANFSEDLCSDDVVYYHGIPHISDEFCNIELCWWY